MSNKIQTLTVKREFFVKKILSLLAEFKKCVNLAD